MGLGRPQSAGSQRRAASATMASAPSRGVGVGKEDLSVVVVLVGGGRRFGKLDPLGSKVVGRDAVVGREENPDPPLVPVKAP